MITPALMFYTPEDMKDLEDRIESYSGSEKAVAWIAAMMAWNLACKLVEESKKEEEEQKKSNKVEFIQQAAKDMIASQSTGE